MKTRNVKTQQLQTSREDNLNTFFLAFIYINDQLMSLKKKRHKKRFWDLVLSVEISLILRTLISGLPKFMFLTIIFLWLEILGNAVNTSIAPLFWSKDHGLLFSWTDSLFYYNALFGADLFLYHQDLLFNSRNTEIHLGERDMVCGEEHLLKKQVTFKLIIMLSMVIFYFISNLSTCIGYSS